MFSAAFTFYLQLEFAKSVLLGEMLITELIIKCINMEDKLLFVCEILPEKGSVTIFWITCVFSKERGESEANSFNPSMHNIPNCSDTL